jgi:hypothetical protein
MKFIIFTIIISLLLIPQEVECCSQFCFHLFHLNKNRETPPPPGEALLRASEFWVEDSSIIMKPGETKKTYATLRVKDDEPGNVVLKIYRIEKYVGSNNKKIPMPEGLEAEIEPSRFYAKAFHNYTSVITIKASPDLSLGEYILCVEELSKEAHGHHPIKVIVKE